MGTDIHTFVEVAIEKKYSHNNNKYTEWIVPDIKFERDYKFNIADRWHMSLDRVKRCEPANYFKFIQYLLNNTSFILLGDRYCNNRKIGTFKTMKEIKSGCSPLNNVYGYRNYDLFAILADVRNGAGFAGIDTGERKKYIAFPRDLPDDISMNVLHESEGWQTESASWLTLTEILDFDWEQVTENRGVVSLEEYKKYKDMPLDKRRPNGWSGQVWGGNTITINEKDFDSTEFDSYKEYYVKMSWLETYKDCVGITWWNFVDELKKLAKKYKGTDNVRIVFWFDS